MNIHAPDQATRERHASLEWIGRRYTKVCKDGNQRTFIRARHKTMGWTLYYCFEDDFAWFPGTVPHLD